MVSKDTINRDMTLKLIRLMQDNTNWVFYCNHLFLSSDGDIFNNRVDIRLTDSLKLDEIIFPLHVPRKELTKNQRLQFDEEIQVVALKKIKDLFQLYGDYTIFNVINEIIDLSFERGGQWREYVDPMRLAYSENEPVRKSVRELISIKVLKNRLFKKVKVSLYNFIRDESKNSYRPGVITLDFTGKQAKALIKKTQEIKDHIITVQV